MLISTSLFCFTLFSQETHNGICGSEVPENFLEIENNNKESFNQYLNDYYNKLHSKTSTAITNVPAKIHIVTDTNGATNITESQILDEIDEANSFLANSFLDKRTLIVPFFASKSIISPFLSKAIGPPTDASGPTCPIQKPLVAPENLPSVISATFSPLP